MINLSIQEAQLFRCLAAHFGSEQVVHGMSVRAACGGDLPIDYVELGRWAAEYKCLFTITDPLSDPKLVVEFEFEGLDIIDVDLIENRKHLEALLKSCGVRYIALGQAEFAESLHPDGSYNFCELLSRKLGVDS